MPTLTRRDFLKVTGTACAGLFAPQLLTSLGAAASSRPNIIVILWDAFSARHLSLYGYQRQTTPHIDAFAGYSTVYHNHYSAGNYTTTGTASMLTGMLPWKHRAINYGGLVRADLADNNPYSLLGSDYSRLAFSQNPWPDRLMGQYHRQIDRFLPPSAYSLQDFPQWIDFFKVDRDLASIAIEDFMFPAQGSSYAGSSLFGYLNKSLTLNAAARQTPPAYSSNCVPTIMDPGYYIPYMNEHVYDGVSYELKTLKRAGTPFFAYFHLYSPHYPYRPHNDFRHLFKNDGYQPVSKPPHPLVSRLWDGYLAGQRELYDRQIAHVDREFGRLFSELYNLGILEDSYVILTSDHGELFERGFVGHGYQLMYEPVLRIPLLIHAPAQRKRQDVHVPTSNIDILPTILSFAGKDSPAVLDGQVLPGFGGSADPERPIFSIVAVDNSAFGDIKKAVISLRKGAYKLIAYLGYEKMSQPFELYDLENDAEELHNLVTSEPVVFEALQDLLFTNLSQANLAASSRETLPP